jgi:signal transduction histidine kinase
LRLGSKLTLYLSLIIILVLSGYGYLHILSRQAVLLTKMKAEVRSTGRTLKVSLEKMPLSLQAEYVQGVVDAVSDYETTVGVVVYYPGQNVYYCSNSVKEDVDPYLNLIKKSIRENLPQEEFAVYKKSPLFSYTFPLKNRSGKTVGGVSILQHTSYAEKEMERAKWSILITIFILIGGTVTLLLWGTRKWVSQPISRLMDGIRNMAKGNLDIRIDMTGKNELSELARSFNRMAADLKNAQQRIIREAEARLELERGLRQSEKLATVGQLASELAHEIGTPLNIILGRTELIKRRVDDRGAVEKNLDIIGNQIEKITKTIQQLLGFVRKKKPDHRQVDINLLLKVTLELLDYQMEKQKLQVVTDFGENLPLVAADPDQLQQVFLNLILNAAQATPEGGTICLRTSIQEIAKTGSPEDRGQYLEISVEDTGIGMANDVMQNIFKPFFTTKNSGTGLGLMVAEGIVEDHEGWIDVESVSGQGSKFKVYFNLTPGEQVKP